MVSAPLRGVHEVRSKGRVYYYAWRGGPRLTGTPGTPEFLASLAEAHASRTTPAKGLFNGVIAAYRASPAYPKNTHTVRAYAAHLADIEERWGKMPLAVVNDVRVRKAFLAWRDGMAHKPRTADMAMGVLKVLLGWAEERVLVTANHAKPIGRLHKVDKSEDIWTAEDLARAGDIESQEVRWAVELGLLTGLRQSDLIRLAWGHDEGDIIAFRTSKRGKAVEIPVTPALRALLGRIERRGPMILTTKRGHRPWTADGLRSSFGKACEAVGIERTFHDLRRTAATVLLAAGIDDTQVAIIMGWSLKAIESLKRRYVSRSAIVAAVVAKLAKAL
jgi:integrase